MEKVKSWLLDNYKEIIYFAISLTAIVLLSVYLSSFFKIECLVGDDLNELRRSMRMNFFQYIFSTEGNRIRPVSNTFVYLELVICKGNVDMIKVFNIISFSLTGFAMLFILHQITHMRVILLIASLLFIYSRFSWYSITQVLGIMENLSITLVLLITYFTYLYLKNGKLLYYILMNVLYLLILFSHERYFIIFISLFVVILINEKNWKQKLIKSATPLLVFGFYYILKTQFLGLLFAVDTGGVSAVKIDVLKIIQQSWTSLLNISQIVISENYLAGITFEQMETGYQNISYVISIATFILMIAAFLYSIYLLVKKKDKEYFLLILFLFITLAFYIAGVSSSFRVEMRFLFPGYCLLLCIISLFFYKILSEKKDYIKLTSISILSVFVSCTILLTNYMNDNIYPYYYIVLGTESGNQLKEELIDKNEERLKEDKLIIFAYSKEDVNYLDLFLNQFNLKHGYEVCLLLDIETLNEKNVDGNLVFLYENGKVTEVNKLENYCVIKDEWLLGLENSFFCYSFTGILTLDFFVLENFTDIEYSIFINGELIQTFKDFSVNQVVHYEYINEKIQDKYFTFTIKSNKFYNPSDHGGTDIRDLQIYLLSFKSDCFSNGILKEPLMNDSVILLDNDKYLSYLKSISLFEGKNIVIGLKDNLLDLVKTYKSYSFYYFNENSFTQIETKDYIKNSGNYWTTGYSTDILCYSETGKVHLSFFTPKEFLTDITYQIKINSQTIETITISPNQTDYTVDYESEELKNSFFILSIVSDKVYIPSLYGGEDIRELQMFIVSLNT